MVSSGEVLADLAALNNEFTSYYKSISGISASIWQGSSKDNLVKVSEEFINEYKSPINSQMTSFAAALDLYKE